MHAETPTATMILSFNFYYARPGRADAVLSQRLRACDVRDNLGVPRGRVWVRRDGSEDLPDVVWELRFEDMDGHLADMAVRAASEDFEAVRAGMRKLCRRFERPLFDICGSVPADAGTTPREGGYATLDWVYSPPDADARVRELLEPQLASADSPRACRSELLRLITPGDDLPRWLLKREFENGESSGRRAGTGAGSREPLSAVAPRVEHSSWSLA